MFSTLRYIAELPGCVLDREVVAAEILQKVLLDYSCLSYCDVTLFLDD